MLRAIEAALASDRSERGREVKDAAQRVARLRPRAHDVLDALVAGRSNKIDLGLSIRTVEVHRARMMERLGNTPAHPSSSHGGVGANALSLELPPLASLEMRHVSDAVTFLESTALDDSHVSSS